MNIFRSLIGKVWQDPNAAEVVKIEEGQLFIVRSGAIRSDRECIYNDAMVTIRRVPSVEHHFQLVVTRVYEEGDQELLEDEDETDEEKQFLIGEQLQFRISETEGEPTLVWRDLAGGTDEFYEFIARSTNAPTMAFFETCMYRAMYERKYRKIPDSTSDADLQEFIWQPPKAANTREASSVSEAPSDHTTTSKSPPSSPITMSKKPAPAKADDALTLNTIASAAAELHNWDQPRGVFVKAADVTARIVHPPGSSSWEYWLVASNAEGQQLAHKMAPTMNYRWAVRKESDVMALSWNHELDGVQSSWCLKFEEMVEFLQFQQIFTKCIWEHSNQNPFEKSKPEEQAYILSQNEDVEMSDVQEDSDEEDEVAADLDKSDDEEESEPEPEADEEDQQPVGKPGERNSQLTVGYKGDRSYVVRGDNIGVFGHTSDHEVKYHATISKLTTPKGRSFKPKHVMLHDQDSKMVLMNESDPHSLFSLDLERGKIVEEWKVHDDIQVNHIAPDNKFAQTTTEQTLVGISHNALFRVDPRISGEKMVDSQYKQYVSKNKFSGVATTAGGHLAVASEKGDIRLFDAIGKNAKTALPPLGDPILGIDVTSDGRWLVATTKTYLLLIDTLIGEGRYTGSLGFERSFPANAKPIPRRLQLRAEHVAYMGHSVAFTPARFNMGEGQEENAIVTSTGEFVIAWDFAKVKKGFLDKYEIKKYEDTVVQDNFKFGDDKEIIVALQNNVLALNKKNMRRPTRASLATSSRNLQSKSSIVNSPY